MLGTRIVRMLRDGHPVRVNLAGMRVGSVVFHAAVTDAVGCAPQKVDATSRSNFFEPIFMVQPAENISRSYPAIGWQLMPVDSRARLRSIARIRDSGSQARMGSSLIVVGNPLPHDRPQMLLAQRIT